MSTRNVFTEESRDTVSAMGVDTDGNGDTTLTFDGLRQIGGPPDVNVQAAGGYVANVQSVSGTQVTVRIHQGGGAATELAAVTGTNGVTDLWAEAVGQ
jgi:hypothetical protein